MPLLPLVDAAFRGAVLALLLLAAAVLLQQRVRGPATAIAIAMAMGLSVQVLSATPWFEEQMPRTWQAPLVGISVANAVLFWVFACTLFIDGFRPRWWHGIAWAIAAALGWLNCAVLAGSGHALAPTTMLLQRLVAPVCALLAAWAALAHWRADLVEWRRRLRGFLVGTGVVYTLAQVGLRMASPDGRLSGVVALMDVLVLLVMAVAAAWDTLLLPAAARGHGHVPAGIGAMAPEASMQPAADASATLRTTSAVPLGADPGNAARGAAPASAPGTASVPEDASTSGHGANAPGSPRDTASTGPDPAEELLARALANAMEQEQAYRSEDLTVTRLATRLAVPEYRLRRLINQRLGHRNFNAFVNGYRLAAARAALADPACRQLPILSIALDAGFGSVGPFNRAFKADTGLTPSEFREQHVADSGIGQPQGVA